MAKSFSTMQNNGNNLLLVDTLNIAFRWKHSGALDFKKEYLETIESLKRSYSAKYVILCADKGKSSYRTAISPEYKANRAALREQQTEEEKLAFKLFFKEYEASLALAKTKYPLIRFDNTEADDIAAYITMQDLDVGHIWLVSTDRDWDLLVNDKVSRFSYVTRKETTVENWSKDYSIEDYISIKALMGDKGDNVIGIAQVGEKRAAALVHQFGSALDVYNALPIESNLKYMKAVNESEELIITNYKLMDLQTFCTHALGKTNVSVIDEVLQQYIRSK